MSYQCNQPLFYFPVVFSHIWPPVPTELSNHNLAGQHCLFFTSAHIWGGKKMSGACMIISFAGDRFVMSWDQHTKTWLKCHQMSFFPPPAGQWDQPNYTSHTISMLSQRKDDWISLINSPTTSSGAATTPRPMILPWFSFCIQLQIALKFILNSPCSLWLLSQDYRFIFLIPKPFGVNTLAKI